LGVSDPRDVVYAHLGMIGMKSQAFVYSDQSRISTTSYKQEEMAINYDKTIVQVYEDTTRFIFQNIPWISMLLHVEEVEQDEGRQGLPSWVPNWTRQWTPKSPRPDNGYYSYLPKVWDGKWLNSLITSGVLAVPGFEFGFVIAVLHESLLPRSPFHDSQPITTQLIDWIQSPTTASNALEALRILIDYHIEQITEIVSHNRLRLMQDFNVPFPEALFSFLAPLIEKWATAFSPDKLRGLAEYGVTGANFVKFLMVLFIQNISVILGQFIPGSGPIALLDSNYILQAPSQVQVHDCVGQFIRTWEGIRPGCANIILRPEPEKEDPNSHAAIRMALSSSDNVKHFRYVGFCGSLTSCNVHDPRPRNSTIFAIH
jgi:hypothetical protein